MLALVLVSLVAAATAAPHFHHHHHHGYSPYSDMGDMGAFGPAFHDDIFDTGRFWQQLETEMQEMEKMINSFHTHFSTGLATSGFVGNQYVIKIPVSGFKESDIAVKARAGVVMVQAVQKVGITQKQYLDVRTLPDNVNEMGVWTYKDEVLTITFPIKTDSNTDATETVTEMLGTVAPPSSREEMATKSSEDVQDADIGVSSDKNHEITYNEIPRVEATTYAVDLKDEYEFVPMHFK